MTGRILLLALALCPALVGCNRAAGKPGPPPAPIVRPSDTARLELFRIAGKIEDPAAVQQIEYYVKSFEDPSKGWTWADLDEYVLRGSYSIQTKYAYETYRKAKILEAKK